MKIPEHLLQWQNNEKIIKELQKIGFLHYDWLITIAFYTCLHKIDIHLHNKGLTDGKIRTHYYRKREVTNNLPSYIARKYIQIETKCRKVRYTQKILNNISKTDLLKYLNIWFNDIKSFK